MAPSLQTANSFALSPVEIFITKPPFHLPFFSFCVLLTFARDHARCQLSVVARLESFFASLGSRVRMSCLIGLTCHARHAISCSLLPLQVSHVRSVNVTQETSVNNSNQNTGSTGMKGKESYLLTVKCQGCILTLSSVFLRAFLSFSNRTCARSSSLFS